MESRYFRYAIKTIFFGKFVGKDDFGNKYYESKNGKRWVIYSDEIDAHQKYLLNGIHGYILLQIKLKKIMTLKYNWQKPHQPNLTGTDKAYYPNKNKNVNKKI